MASPITFTTIAALAVAGVAGGLYLGEAAVAEIDPVHYGSPLESDTFHADLVPNAPDWDSGSAKFQDASFAIGLGDGCVGCRADPAEYAPVHDPSVDAFPTYAEYEPVRADAIIEDVEAEIAAIARRAAREAALARVERYAHFQVSADEKPAPADAKLVRIAQPASESAADCVVEDQCAGKPTPGI